MFLSLCFSFQYCPLYHYQLLYSVVALALVQVKRRELSDRWNWCITSCCASRLGTVTENVILRGVFLPFF